MGSGKWGDEGLHCPISEHTNWAGNLERQKQLLHAQKKKKIPACKKTIQYFKILKYLAPRKHEFNLSALLPHFSSRFYSQKGISRLCFSNIYCITEKAKESKTPSLAGLLIASQISVEPKGLRKTRMLINTPRAAL